LLLQEISLFHWNLCRINNVKSDKYTFFEIFLMMHLDNTKKERRELFNLCLTKTGD